MLTAAEAFAFAVSGAPGRHFQDCLNTDFMTVLFTQSWVHPKGQRSGIMWRGSVKCVHRLWPTWSCYIPLQPDPLIHCAAVLPWQPGWKGAEMYAQIQPLVKTLEEMLENKCHTNECFSSLLEWRIPVTYVYMVAVLSPHVPLIFSLLSFLCVLRVCFSFDSIVDRVSSSLQMISSGSSGRLMCCRDTLSPYASTGREFLYTKLTRRSGGSPTDTHTSSLETGAVFYRYLHLTFHYKQKTTCMKASSK